MHLKVLNGFTFARVCPYPANCSAREQRDCEVIQQLRKSYFLIVRKSQFQAKTGSANTFFFLFFDVPIYSYEQ